MDIPALKTFLAVAQRGVEHDNSGGIVAHGTQL
jgi:hypothetical protein